MPKTLKHSYLNRSEYILTEDKELYIHKDYIGVNEYLYKDEEGNMKPIVFGKRWWDGESGATDDYLGYVDDKGDECIVKWIVED
jgi:hypothetical protein